MGLADSGEGGQAGDSRVPEEGAIEIVSGVAKEEGSAVDKELIAMCDCPEIQERIGFENWDHIAVTARDGSFPVKGDTVYHPSLKWLLREIGGSLKKWQEFQLHITGLDEYFALIVDARRRYGDARSLIFSSRMQRDIRIALLHVFMWQKGKVWKDGEWVKS